MGWNSIKSCPEDVVVLTKIDDGFGTSYVEPLRKRHTFFFTPDDLTIVNHEPTHWKHLIPSSVPIKWRIH